ncbi:ABC transporter substrate-binding protein [Skermania piniformis]|uniref:Thiamine pyrimidine synthase n=1 Tax=Skermania pinensis TaxID=39122 RepID=A0ABX8SCJ4_9ACTN|nr:ABC transporter substrate-binding protein [Skermania piniformis]QXQ14704.1 ABC transporter substrate-binding protein [Skermania piniformis]
MRRSVIVLVALLALVTSCATDQPQDKTTIRFALDWMPNTNHSGLYVALRQGWFADAGLDVQVVPYGQTAPDNLMDSGNAEFGISFQSSSVFAQAAGAKVVSVLAPLQHRATAIGVRADRADLVSPKSLDGKTYAGFGDAGEVEVLRQIIRNDGGTGDFRNVTLGTSAFAMVYSDQADFTVPYLTWEGIEAQLNGTPFKYFQFSDYGIPDEYAVVIDASRAWLADNPDAARKFVQVLQRGYQLAADDPAKAAQDLIDSNPDSFDDPALVTTSQNLLAAEYMKDADGKVGNQTLARWTDYSRLLYQHGLLADGEGQPLTREPDWSTYFTDAYLANP